MDSKDMRRTAVVTGASSGVGLAAAVQLAGKGWNVIGLGRDPDRSDAALAAIRAAAVPGAQVEMVRGDLSSLADTARMADEVLALTGTIHALCNNAGGVRAAMAITDEGNEATFVANHLGHFLLTQRLLPVLRATAAQEPPGTVRVISVSSEGHKTRPDGLDWDDLQGVHGWRSGRNYSSAKLCNLLFTFELARREADSGIVAHAMHPGEVGSNFASHAPDDMKAHMTKLNLIPPEVSGRILSWLASSEEAGRMPSDYFFNCRSAEMAPTARDDASAARLWAESEALVARAGL